MKKRNYYDISFSQNVLFSFPLSFLLFLPKMFKDFSESFVNIEVNIKIIRQNMCIRKSA